MKRLSLSLALLIAGGALGCSTSKTDTSTTLLLLPGMEDDLWTSEPEVVEVALQRVSSDGTRETVTTTTPPADDEFLSVSLKGEEDAWYEVEGRDADGEVRVRALPGAVYPNDETGVPIRVFAARVNQFSRPPSNLFVGQGLEPPAAMFGDSWLLVAGVRYDDSAVRLDGYSVDAWAPLMATLVPCPSIGCETKSLVALPSGLAIMVGNDWAVYADYACGTDCTGDLGLPDGFESFRDIAGGRTIHAPGGARIIVGATRQEDAATGVVQFHPDDWEIAGNHETPRAGAAAVWVLDRGLLIVGGAAEGSGAELWDEETYEFEALPYPSDETRGAALVAFDAERVLRVGGIGADDEPAASVIYDLDCEEDCIPEPYGPAIELRDVEAFRINDEVVVVGSNSEGIMEGRRLTSNGVEPIHLREPRVGGRAVQTQLGQVIVVGGELENGEAALNLELYQPSPAID